MTTALYRRYRPDTFAEVIGQAHVTEPLQQALRANRVTHAYLFSGPRGCGKTTSARILARCLNCAEGPTDVPCGVCDSCVDLARGGAGSLDVVEIDAASHNGVDDARDLRERAAYAPARDRYKIFILDEAHMVTTQGFNALLKIVEEPPPHVKFIFATTEPDKVIGTIRSRTHHYPFRLVPPDILQAYLEQICASEGVSVGPGVLPLVVRAGAGSVRDSLSVLDQLMAGARDTGVDYERAVALLGYTPATLLDDAVAAIAARDGASVFRVVDRVISSGHEPRRFVEDLLERLRDLIIIAASGDAADAVLRDLPADQLARMRTEAGHLGIAELSRAADLVNAALSEMTGATSPRLHLELLCARLLLPAADDGAAGHGARLDYLERRLGAAGTDLTSVPPSVSAPAPVRAPARPAAPAPEPAPDAAVPTIPGPAPELARESAPTTPLEAPAPVRPEAAEQASARVEEPAAPVAPAASSAAGGSLETEVLRRRWPEVLETVGKLRRVTRALIDQQNAQVASLTSETLRLTFTTAPLAAAFRAGAHAEVVQRAVRETLGFDVRVEGSLDETPRTSAARQPVDPPAATAAGSATSRRGAGSVPAGEPEPMPGPVDAPEPDVIDEPEPDWPEVAIPGGARSVAQPSPPAAAEATASSAGRLPTGRPSRSPSGSSATSERPPVARGTRAAASGRASTVRATRLPAPDEEEDLDPSDAPLIEGSGLVGAPLIAQLLGGTVIDEAIDGAP